MNINSVQSHRHSLSLMRQPNVSEENSVLSGARGSRLDMAERESAHQGGSESRHSTGWISNSADAAPFGGLQNQKFIEYTDTILELKPFTNGKPLMDADFIKSPFTNGKPLIQPDFIKPPFDLGRPIDNSPVKGLVDAISELMQIQQGGEVELADPAMRESHQNGINSYQDIDGEVFVDGAAMTDIDQGKIADCYFVTALASLAKNSPETLENMITDNENGTYTVHFGGELGDVTVDDDFAVDGAGNHLYAGTGDDSNPELWVAIIEKAFAQEKGGYNAIEYGRANEALTELTGQDDFTLVAPGAVAPELLQEAIANEQSVTASTFAGDSGKKGDLPNGMVRNHAYVVNDVRQNESGEWEVQVYNPHATDPNSGDGSNDGFTWMSYEDFSASFRQVQVMNEPFADAA